MIFYPLFRHVIFFTSIVPFCNNSSLNSIYFSLQLTIFSFFPFNTFLSLSFSFPFSLSFLFLSFLPFSLTFSPFFSFPFYIFPPMTTADFPLPCGYFSIYRPLYKHQIIVTEIFKQYLYLTETKR
jgi:hypothetical protein